MPITDFTIGMENALQKIIKFISIVCINSKYSDMFNLYILSDKSCYTNLYNLNSIVQYISQNAISDL